MYWVRPGGTSRVPTMVAISTKFGFFRFTWVYHHSHSILLIYSSNPIQSLSLFTTNLVVSTSIPTGVKKGDVFSKDLESSHCSSLTNFLPYSPVTHWGYRNRCILAFFASLSRRFPFDTSCCNAACLAFKSSHEFRGEVYMVIQRVK
jgi:hypothetical protein